MASDSVTYPPRRSWTLSWALLIQSAFGPRGQGRETTWSSPCGWRIALKPQRSQPLCRQSWSGVRSARSNSTYWKDMIPVPALNRAPLDLGTYDFQILEARNCNLNTLCLDAVRPKLSAHLQGSLAVFDNGWWPQRFEPLRQMTCCWAHTTGTMWEMTAVSDFISPGS